MSGAVSRPPDEQLNRYVAGQVGDGTVLVADWLHDVEEEGVDLFRGAADVFSGVEGTAQVDAGECRIALQSRDEIIRQSFRLHLAGGLLTVDANPLVQILPVAASLHAGHQDLFGRHERQLF
jgi:hypothetical protein